MNSIKSTEAALRKAFDILKAEKEALALENIMLKHGSDEILPFTNELETPTTDAVVREIKAQVWRDALTLAKSTIATDSLDHIDFLFKGKIEQVLTSEITP